MVRRIGGFRKKTRKKLRKNIRCAGKISLRRYFQEFKIGDRISLAAEPAIQKGMYFPRYHGKSGKVISKNGTCYTILIKDQNKEKTLIVHPIHMKRL